MAIIKYTKNDNLVFEYLAQFPDQYVSEKEKESDDFWKQNMDYFATVAYSQYSKNRRRFSGNYDLMKGIIRPSDFYEEPNTRSFVDVLEDEVELPSHVKHYPILNPPVNTLLGELSKRPDTSRVKAFDEDSQNEELAYRTDVLKQYIMQRARVGLAQQFASQGVNMDDLKPEEVEQMTAEKVQDYMTSYTSLAERWGNNVLEALKVQFNLKEKSEDAFRDLLITSTEFYHIFETTTNSIGLDVECISRKNVWNLGTPDRKYSRDWYAGGTIEIMELSEIIDKVPEITKEEIDHLRKGSQEFSLLGTRDSNLTNPNRPIGINSITYDTYDPAVLEERLLIESQLKENTDDLSDFFGLSNSVSAFGNKFAVVRSYWRSKIKVGKLTYFDQQTGKAETILVDENYKNQDNPFQIDEVEWAYMNQWYYGVKVGPDVYHVKPYKLLPYMPVIGVVHELKNTQARSLVDLMKPFQMIYNVCMNQLWKLLEKEIGVLYNVNIRKIPTPKDGNAQDALEIWELEAREKGVSFEDDSPENMKAASGNTNLSRAIDLSRTNEIQSRYNLAAQMKLECWELVGLSRERVGSIVASQTATGTNTALAQSYAQTENYFVQHEYVLNELYQALLDASQYLESHKPTSTISYVNGLGENSFISINGNELSLKDLKVFVSSRAKDEQAFNQLQQLSQAALQNGASLYEISELYTTSSMRKLKDTFKKLKERQDDLINQQQQLEQQKLQQAQAQFEQSQQMSEYIRQEITINDNSQKELDRISKERIAIIQTFGGSENSTQSETESIPSVLETSKIANDQTAAFNDYEIKLQQLTAQKQEILNKKELALREIEVKKQALALKDKEIDSKERIAKTNKNRYDSKSKSKK